MRVYPPVPTLTREAERNTELGGYHIQKGTMLGVAVFSMHNNPAYWKVSARAILARAGTALQNRASVTFLARQALPALLRSSRMHASCFANQRTDSV